MKQEPSEFRGYPQICSPLPCEEWRRLRARLLSCLSVFSVVVIVDLQSYGESASGDELSLSLPLSSGSDFAQSKSFPPAPLLLPNSARYPHPCYQNWKFPSLSGVDSVLMYAGFCRRSRWRSLARRITHLPRASLASLPASLAIQPPNFPFPSFLLVFLPSPLPSFAPRIVWASIRQSGKHQYLNA